MSVVDAARNLYAEFQASRESPDRFRAHAFRQYLQMQVRVILGQRFPRAWRMPKASTIFGRVCNCASYETAAGIFKEIFLRGEYHFVSAVSRPLIVDAGANIGIASLYFHVLYPDCRVLAFEPDPTAFSLLHRNVEANHLHVRCVNAAVGAAEGSSSIYVDPHCQGGVAASLFQVGGLSTAVDVQVVQLSRYITEPVELLKLDVEGAETAVLRDLAESGKITEVRQAIIEFHPHKGQPANDLQECVRLLEPHFTVEVEVHRGATMIRAVANRV